MGILSGMKKAPRSDPKRWAEAGAVSVDCGWRKRGGKKAQPEASFDGGMGCIIKWNRGKREGRRSLIQRDRTKGSVHSDHPNANRGGAYGPQWGFQL
jgi:hypothetical protein